MEKRLAHLFLFLALVGAVLPLCALVPFLSTNGLDAQLFVQQLTQTPVSRFFALDVFVSALTFWLFVYTEGRRLAMKNLWLYVICTLLVGVSLALPLFLYARARTDGR